MQRCGGCGEDSQERARFCSGCGAAFGPRVEHRERRTVSVLFCDLVGFTEWSEATDPEDVRAMLDAYYAWARDVLERYGGTVEKYIGDAVMAVFGVPVSHEDDAVRAVLAGLTLVAAPVDGSGAVLPLRVGLATGEVLASLTARPERGESVVAGDVVNTAARLQASAPTAAVVVDKATQGLAQHRIRFAMIPAVRVKGKADSIAVGRAIGPRRADADGCGAHGPRLVGRDDVLGRLRDDLADAARAARPRLVTLVGDAGIGKTRIVRELRVLAGGQDADVVWREGACLPFGEGVTFWPLSEIVRGHAGIGGDDSAALARVRLAATIDPAVVEPERAWQGRMLSALIGVGTDFGATTEETFAAWRRFFWSMSGAGPAVVVVEDLHWAEPALTGFLLSLLETAPPSRLLIVATARPEFLDRNPGWSDGVERSVIRLSPLSDPESAELLLDLGVNPRALDEMIDRAGGNPLYARELARFMEQQHGSRAVPDTLRAVIAARLDLLPLRTRGMLQDAAVVGTAFGIDHLMACDPGRSDAAILLGELAERDIIRPSAAGTDAEFRFSHDLVREVAYSQVPRRVRLERHLAVATWIEARSDRVLAQIEVVVHHYETALKIADRTSDDRESAIIERLRSNRVQAGEQAIHLDVAAANAHFHRALQLCPDDHPERPAMLRNAGWAALSIGDTDRAAAYLRDATRTGVELGDVRTAAGAATKLAWMMQDKFGDSATAGELGRRARTLLADEPACYEQADAAQQLGWLDVFAGRFDAALAAGTEAVSIATRAELNEARSGGLVLRGVARVMLDDPGGVEDVDSAVAVLRQVLDAGKASEAGSLNLVSAYINLAELRWLVDGPEAGLQVAETLHTFLALRGLMDRLHEAQADGLKILLDRGSWDRLIEEAEAAIAWCRAHNGHYATVLATSRWAQVEIHRSHPATAARLLATALPAARDIGDLQVLGPALEAAVTVATARGEWVEAQALLEEFTRTAAEVPSRRAEHLPAMLRACAATGRTDLADELVAGTDLRIRRHACSHRHGLAALAETRQDWRAATDLYAAAAHDWNDYGNRLEHAYAASGLARCGERIGDVRAPGARNAATTEFARLGAVRIP